MWKIKVNANYYSKESVIERILTVKLLGYIDNGKYCKGIKELPLIDNECFLLNDSEFNLIHQFASNDIPIEIGALALDDRQKIALGVNSLFSSHIGIFGNTGSGKSYTLAKVYRQLFKKMSPNEKFKENARFLLFDFNGEYHAPDVIIANKTVYNLSTKHSKGDKLPFTQEDLLKPELFNILASASEKTQQPFISRTLKFYKKVTDSDEPLNHFKNILKKYIKQILCMTDNQKAGLLLDYVEQLLPPNIDEHGLDKGYRHDFAWHGNKHTYYAKTGAIPYFDQSPDLIENLDIYTSVEHFDFSENFIDRIIDFLYLQLIFDVLSNRANNEHIAPAINKLKSLHKDFDKVIEIVDSADNFWSNNFLCIINLNDVNITMKKLLPLLISFKLYSEHKEHKKADEDLSKSLNIIIDEAHNILSYDSLRESESWKDFRLETFEEIIKEGRKFGVFLTIASQRPSDISHTIISQLHNYFIHRLVNNKDLDMIEKTISYLDKLSVESLPILGTGSCVLSGIIAQMPIVVQIDCIEHKHRPHNETIKLTNNWLDA